LVGAFEGVLVGDIVGFPAEILGIKVGTTVGIAVGDVVG